MRLTLYKKLKPEFKKSLLDNLEEYPNSITDVIKALGTKYHWSQLSVGDATSLISFTSHPMSEMTDADWITGRVFFNELED
tara:strand:- start:273 stop:515 length:243 start_codon:yes stop_codon:yes gene_type:complete